MHRRTSRRHSGVDGLFREVVFRLEAIVDEEGKREEEEDSRSRLLSDSLECVVDVALESVEVVGVDQALDEEEELLPLRPQQNSAPA